MITTSTPATATSASTEDAALVTLLRRNAAIFQVVFATFWFLRLALVATSAIGWAVFVTGTATALTGATAARHNAIGLRARDAFRTARGRVFLRPVTIISTTQLIASIVLPWLAAAAGATEWVAPLVAITIGLFLVAFATPLRVPPIRVIGVIATVVPAVLPLLMNSDALVLAVAATLGTALTCSVWLCARAAAADPLPRSG